MKYKINPFAFVGKLDDNYFFIPANNTEPRAFVFTENQEENLSELFSGKEFDYDELCKIYTKEQIEYFMSNNILCVEIPDTKGIYSRTDAFFSTYNMPKAREALNQKHVLILGCGGIGTHMAWHMATLGVGKLTLLDFDTVEKSNFNRQILFDNDDIGKKKVDILSTKLSKINEKTEIRIIDQRINSVETLETVCTSDNFDLIIKSLDSPVEISKWLDIVCKKHKLPYIAGITMQKNALIGPTFIPDKSEIGWSDLINTPQTAERIYGTAPSIGIMLYHISDELAIEAFKFLTGYGKLKYCGKISFVDIFDNTEYSLPNIPNTASNNQPVQSIEAKKGFIIGISLILALSVCSFIEPWLSVAAFGMAMILPFYLYKKRDNILKCTFAFSMIFSLLFGLMLMRSELISPFFAESIQTVFALTIVFSISGGLILLMCVLNYLIAKSTKKI